MQKDLVEIQTLIAFQEDTISRLNEVVTRQQRQLDQLKGEVRQLQERYLDLLHRTEGEPGEEKPPHY